MGMPAWAQWGALALCSPIALVLAAIVSSLVSRMGTILWLRWRYRHIPGPTPNLLMGNFIDIIKYGGIHLANHHWQKEYGPLFKIFFMHVMFVVTTDPDTAHQLTHKLTGRPRLPTPSLELLPKKLNLKPPGLVAADGSHWRMLRNAWQPAFAPGSLLGYTQPMTEAAQQLVKALSNLTGIKNSDTSEHAAVTGNGTSALPASNGNTEDVSDDDQYVDLHELFSSMTLDVVGTCAYGIKFNLYNAGRGADGQPVPSSALSSVGPVLKRAIQDFAKRTSLTSGTKYGKFATLVPNLMPVIRPIAQAFPDEAFGKLMEARRTIVHISKALIDDWHARVQSEHAFMSAPSGGADAVAHVKMTTAPASVKKTGGLGGIEPGSFLGLLLEAQHKASLDKNAEQLEDKGIASQANTFLVAGTETTANTLTYAAYFLSHHPDKLERLLQEVDAHGRDKPVGPNDEFPYTTAVVYEALRLLPVAPILGRNVDRPEGLQVGPHKIDHGTNVMCAVWTMHRNPHIWPRAEEFLPERWLPEGEKELGCRNMHAYIPFGAGPRKCIGVKFSLQESRIALATTFKHFTFELKPGQVPLATEQFIALSPKRGLWVKPVPRQPHSVTAQ